MKKYILLLSAFLILTGCKTEYQRALQSADKEFMLKMAEQKFQKKKWGDALALYERLSNLVAGTDDAPNVVFNSATANFYDKNYKLAGYQFKNFSVTFPLDPRKEEAAYMSALCYYEGSLDYNLDQSSTESAINELQDFLNNYADSERSKNINELVEELSYKLELKAFENAKQYYKMAEYKAANVAFENVLFDFPGTKLRSKIYDYMLKSQYELAVKSRFDLKKERIESATAFTKQIENEVPNSDLAKTAKELRDKLSKEMEDYNKQLVVNEQNKAEYEKRLKALEEKDNAKKQKQEARDAAKTSRDSAKISTPKPAATFDIK